MTKAREMGAVGDRTGGIGAGRGGGLKSGREFVASIKGEKAATRGQEAANRQDAQRLIAGMRRGASKERLAQALRSVKVREYDHDVAPPSDRGAYKKGAGPRGRDIHGSLGENLPTNTKTIDSWNPQTGEVSSIKTHDLQAASIRDGNKFAATLKKNIDKLSGYQGKPATRNSPEIRPGNIKQRTLKLGFERGVPLTPAQRDAIKQAVEYGQSLNNKVEVTIFRHNGPGTMSARGYRASAAPRPGRQSDNGGT